MDYPPITHLISATFDGLKKKDSTSSLSFVTQAPQPVANAPGMGESETLGVGSAATSGTNRVGTVLNTVA